MIVVYRLLTYLIYVNVESEGWFSKVPVDYVFVENNRKSFCGSRKPQLITAENKTTRFRFLSDWSTTAKLRNPKGFILYFKS